MKKSFFPILLSLLMTSSIFAQSDDHFVCGLSPEMEQELTGPLPPALDICFDISFVQETCTFVYINVNVHFFLDDNCEGEIATVPGVQGDLSPQNAFQLAEDMIQDANTFLEVMSNNGEGQWFAAQHDAEVTTPQCVPVRYVLSGVEIHCDTDAQSTGINFSEFNGYITNGTSEVNIFISNVAAGPNGFGSNNSNNIAIENFGGGALNHEMGHVLSLGHVFLANNGDGCDDTWDPSWEWDADGDGTIDVSGSACWLNDEAHNQYNGQNACDASLFDPTAPCCEAVNQNNNLMSYGGFSINPIYSALTPCQITRMLTDLSDNMCDYVAGVGGACPPPKANIGTIPTLAQTLDCPTCFYLSSSFNESLYDIQITDEYGSTITNTGHISGEAKKYCIRPTFGGNWPVGFETGKTYTITLTVQNDCGDTDTEGLTFTLPPPCSIGQDDPQPPNFKFKNLSPNPATNSVSIDFDLNSIGDLNIYGVHSSSSTGYGLVAQYSLGIGDGQQVSLNIGDWLVGANSVVFEFEGGIHVANLIKQ